MSNDVMYHCFSQKCKILYSAPVSYSDTLGTLVHCLGMQALPCCCYSHRRQFKNLWPLITFISRIDYFKFSNHILFFEHINRVTHHFSFSIMILLPFYSPKTQLWVHSIRLENHLSPSYFLICVITPSVQWNTVLFLPLLTSLKIPKFNIWNNKILKILLIPCSLWSAWQYWMQSWKEMCSCTL